MENERLMTMAQRARKSRDLMLKSEYESILMQYPGSTNAQVLEEMVRRGSGGLHSSAGIRRILVKVGVITPKVRGSRTARAAEGGAE